jgi:MscS family membrane protein
MSVKADQNGNDAMKSPTWKCALFILLLQFFTSPLLAQDSHSPVDSNETVQSSPRETVRMVLASISGASSRPLSNYFDTRKTKLYDSNSLNKVITKFPNIMDTYGSIMPLGLLSNNSLGSEEADLPINQERVGVIKLNGNNIDMILERVDTNSVGPVWLLSQQTIYELSLIVNDINVTKINQMLPHVLLDNTWRGAPIGQWFSVIVITLLCIAIGWAISFIINVAAKRYSKKYKQAKTSQVIRALAIPVAIVAGVFTYLLIVRYLEVSILIRQDLAIFTVSLLWVAVFIFLWSLVDKLSEHGEQLLRQKNKVGSLSIVLFVRGSAKVVLFSLALIFVLDSNGVDVTTGLAALGIGGIALALGAQKAIENLVGSITLVADQPLRVGDFCKIGDQLGTVENIGMRSTRIRTLEDTLVTLPNGLLSSERIENFTLRRKFLLRTTLNLRYETTADDLEMLLDKMRSLLASFDYIDSNPRRVRFINYGSASLDIEIYAYIIADNYEEFLQRKESLLLQLKSLVETSGSGFAFPSQTLYLSQDDAPTPIAKEQ